MHIIVHTLPLTSASSVLAQHGIRAAVADLIPIPQGRDCDITLQGGGGLGRSPALDGLSHSTFDALPMMDGMIGICI